MARTVASSISDFHLQPQFISHSTVDISYRNDAGNTVKHFSTVNVTIAGTTYTDRLKSFGDLKQSSETTQDRINVVIRNHDRAIGIDVANDLRYFDFAPIICGRFWQYELNPAFIVQRTLWRGRCVAASVNEREVKFNVVSETEAAGYAVSIDTLSEANGWTVPYNQDAAPPSTGGGDSGGGGFRGTCLTGETLISLGSGDSKPIAEIRTGDFVTAFCEKTRRTKSCRVLGTSRHLVKQYLSLDFGETVLRVTPEHLIYTIRGEFIPAGLVQVGRTGTIVCLETGRPVSLLKVTRQNLKKPIEVFNLDVADFHTYFANQVPVHNRKADLPFTD